MSWGARTAVGMGTTWGCRIEAINQEMGGFVDTAQTQTVSVWSLGGGAALTNYSRDYEAGTNCYGPPLEHEATNEPEQWWGYYQPFLVSAAAPGDSAEAQVYLWVGDEFRGAPGPPLLPDGATVLVRNLSVDVNVAVSGLYLKRARTATVPYDRQMMDFTDLLATDRWYADANSAVTVTASGPGVSLSVTGSLGYQEGQEVEIGSTFFLSASLALNWAAAAGTPYARISGINWSLAGVDLSNLDLYRPGDPNSIPDPTYAPGWSRRSSGQDCFRVTDDGGMAMWSTAATRASSGWSGFVGAPTLVNFIPEDGMFSDDFSYDITYEGSPIEWYIDEGDGQWHWRRKEFSGKLSVAQFYKTWEFEHEWRKLSPGPYYVDVKQQWREENNEDVGDPESPTENDQRCGLLCYPINRPSLTGAPYWGPLVSVGQAATVNVNDPQGYEEFSRPSDWTSADTNKVVVNPSNRNEFQVIGGTAGAPPEIYRDLKTRYWWRMDRLADHLDDPEAEHNPLWPIMLKANLPIETTLDDPDWWDPQAGGIELEDVTNWDNYSYLKLQIDSDTDRDVTWTMYVDYSIVSVYDPCYTCFEHRYGALGEFTYTRSYQRLTFQFTVKPGEQRYLIDLTLNDEKVTPEGIYRIQHVDRVIFVLPPKPEEHADEIYELQEFRLSLDDPAWPTVDWEDRETPDYHLAVRYKPAWDWLGNFFGFGAQTDGKTVLQPDYGYSYSRYEKGLLYIGHRQHCPESELTDRLDYAKALGELFAEISFQEGFGATYHYPEQSAGNQDADENRFASTFYWWDLRQSHEWTSDGIAIGMDGAVCVGTISPLAGTPVDVYFTKYPRGRLRGIAFVDIEGFRARCRNDGAIWLYGREIGTETWTLLGGAIPDAHGSYQLAPVWEKDWEYRLVGK